MANEHAPFSPDRSASHDRRDDFEIIRGGQTERPPFTELPLEEQQTIIIDQLIATHRQCMMAGIHDERYWNKTSFLMSLLGEIRDKMETTGRWGNNYGD